MLVLVVLKQSFYQYPGIILSDLVTVKASEALVDSHVGPVWVWLTGLALPGEPQNPAVVSVGEQVRQAEVAPVGVRVQTQQFLRPDEQWRQRIVLILLGHYLRNKGEDSLYSTGSETNGYKYIPSSEKERVLLQLF